MEKLRSLKKSLSGLLAADQTVCLWFSGGADSRLLLEVLLEIEKPFGILTFGDGWSRGQRQITDGVIKKRNLQVFSYPPRVHLLVGDGENLALASSYAVDDLGSSAILLRDITDGETCAFDLKLDLAKRQNAPIAFDVHIWGTRQDDRHFVFGNEPLALSDSWRVGDKRFVVPLFDWKRAEVLAGLKIYGVDYAAPDEDSDTGNIACCSKCLITTGTVFCPKTGAEISCAVWQPQENLKNFRASLGR